MVIKVYGCYVNRRLVFEGVILFVIVFQSIIEQYMAIFGLLDEIIALFFGWIYIVKMKKGRRIDIYEFLLIIFVLIFFVCGWVSTFINGYQGVAISAASSFLAVKYFILMLGVKAYDKKIFLYSNGPIIANIILFTLYYLISLCLVNVYDVYPWDLCGKCVFLTALLIINYSKRWMERICLVLLMILLICSGKAKGLAALMIIIFLLFYSVCKKKKMQLLDIVLCGIAIVISAWKKIYYYYILGKGEFARSIMINTGFKIASDRFPFGTGWGTFGSYYSSVNYSKVYYLYNLYHHRELGEKTRAFIMDAYWPSVMAENGWIGTIAIMGIILVLFICFNRISASKMNYYAAGMICLSYMLITTFEETGFAQPVLMCIAIAMGLLLKEENMTSDARRCSIASS